MPRADLLVLAAKVRGAKGPSRDLDNRIAVAAGLAEFRYGHNGVRYPGIYTLDSAGSTNTGHVAGFYTYSVDAIIALISEKLPRAQVGMRCSSRAGWADAYVGKHPEWDGGRWVWAATPALALCAAFLEAMAALTDAGGGNG